MDTDPPRYCFCPQLLDCTWFKTRWKSGKNNLGVIAPCFQPCHTLVRVGIQLRPDRTSVSAYSESTILPKTATKAGTVTVNQATYGLSESSSKFQSRLEATSLPDPTVPTTAPPKARSPILVNFLTLDNTVQAKPTPLKLAPALIAQPMPTPTPRSSTRRPTKLVNFLTADGRAPVPHKASKRLSFLNPDGHATSAPHNKQNLLPAKEEIDTSPHGIMSDGTPKPTPFKDLIVQALRLIRKHRSNKKQNKNPSTDPRTTPTHAPKPTSTHPRPTSTPNW